jgi:hypothetical protein
METAARRIGLRFGAVWKGGRPMCGLIERQNLGLESARRTAIRA